MNDNNDELVFLEEDDVIKAASEDNIPWKILIVDDEKSVHQVTEQVLGNFSFDNRGIKFVKAFSGKEAKKMMQTNADVAVILLDVVMETDEAGLDVARYIRKELGNKFVRIILRTGQPGKAPEKKVIVEFDINDYKDKTELTVQKLYTTITTGLRSYRDLILIEQHRLGLEQIVEASHQLFITQSFEVLSEKLFEHINNFASKTNPQQKEEIEGILAVKHGDNFSIAYAKGNYKKDLQKPLSTIVPNHLVDFFQESMKETGGHFHDQYLIYSADNKDKVKIIIFIDGKHKFCQLEKDLLQIYFTNFTLAFENISIKHGLEQLVEARTKKLKTANINLQKAKDIAYHNVKIKSEFLANMSHEIRTPMNGVIAATDLAINDNKDAKVGYFLKIIKNSGQSLMGIINDILDFSKIEAGRLDLEEVPFQLDDLLEQVAGLFASKIYEKEMELILDIDPATPLSLEGDPLRLNQIMTNLIGNAIKFSSQEGIIEVGVKLKKTGRNHVKNNSATQIQFCVKDTGIGIDPARLAQLFDPYTQAESHTSRKFGGTGLGLSISKQLVELMHGEIWAESIEGQGTNFFFTVNIKMQEKDETHRLIIPESLKTKKVLIVDNCMATRQLLKKILVYHEIPCETTASGIQAIEKLKSSTAAIPFSYIILDWHMPHQNGIEVAQIIRQELKISTPIIMLTGFGRKDEKRALYSVKINGFLNKPIRPMALIEELIHLSGAKQWLDTQPEPAVTDQTVAYKKSLNGTHILLAEDNLTNQAIMQAIFSGTGIQLTIAHNGQEALDLIKGKPFDAVLMDIQMPLMDGWEATRKIRENSQFDNLPIIAMTAYVMQEDRQNCKQAGMNGYISKPINQKKLFETLGKLVRPSSEIDVQVGTTIAFKQHRSGKETKDRQLHKIPGINTDTAMSVLGFSWESYQHILMNFYTHNKTTVQNLRQNYEEGNWKGLRNIAHSLKGSAGNIGAYELQKQAQLLEIAGNQSQHTKPDVMLVNRVESALNQVCKGIASLEENSEEEESDVNISDINHDRLSTLLQNLYDSMLIADPEETTVQLEALKKMIGATRIATMANSIQAYEYDKALALLREFADQFEVSIVSSRA